MRVRFLLFLVALVGYAQSAEEVMQRAISDFQNGRIAQSVDGFNRVAKLAPEFAPQLWQRGIALYYAGKYKECRAQFESHRTVNPDDVENAAWHFLCVARAENPAKARAALLPVGPDPRKPMAEVYRMFKGEMTPEQVITAGGASLDAQFYAHLYAGLYYEATGNRERAFQQILAASDERYSGGGYMYGVAKVHLELLRRTK